MEKILTLSFWLDARPGAFDYLEFRLYMAVVLILLIAALGSGILKKRKKGLYVRIFTKIQTFGWVNFFVALLYLLFRQELIPYLSTPVLMILWLIGDLVWLFFIGKESKRIPQIIQQREKEQEYKKYIP